MENKRTMLIVDDSAINKKMFVAIFKNDYNIIEAEDGVAAMRALEESYSKISVILLDLYMPNKDGFEVIKEIRSNPEFSLIPIIVVTAENEIQSEIRALELGADDFISKPIDIRIIRKRVNIHAESLELKNVKISNLILEKQLEHQKQMTELLDNVPGGISIYEMTDRIRMISGNEGLEKMLGYDTGSILKIESIDIENFVHPADWNDFIKFAHISISTLSPFNYTLRVKKADGSYLWVMLSVAPIKHTPDTPVQLYTLIVDATDEQCVKEELKYRAEFDALTGLHNKETFYLRTKDIISKNPDKEYIIICFDIEHFKVINDLFGRDTGDTILIEIANMIKSISGILVSCCRLEADHFAICVEKDNFDLSKFSNITEALFNSFGIEHNVIVGMGIYQVKEPSLSVDQMCDRANLALNTIKGNYLKHYAYYDDKLRDTLLEEQEIRSTMSAALSENQFHIYLQPIHCLSRECTISAEVLVRWIHPQKGVISPGKFIPLFEKCGFIAKLDAYVWEQACKYLKKRREEGLTEIPVSVNCSRMSLYNPNLVNEIIALTKKYEIKPSLFKVEVTESAYTDNPEQLVSTINALQKNGFAVLMDDFGSGYSSLNTLKDIPVDILKIDIKFLQGIEKSDRASSIITSVVRMAKWLKLPVIAEGVETKTQLDFLRSIGCDRIQGYYYAKPMPCNEFEEYISKEETSPEQISDSEIINDEDFDLLFNENGLVSHLINSVCGAVGFYQLVEERLEVIRVNNTYYDILGYTVEQRNSKSLNVFDSVPSEDRQSLNDACRLAVSTKKSTHVILRHEHGSGKMIWIDNYITYIGGSAESPFLCISFNDITEKIVNEHELKTITDTLPGGIAVYEIGGDNNIRALYTNPGYTKITGYSEEEYHSLGIENDVTRIVHPDDIPMLLEKLRYSISNNVSGASAECRMYKKDGSLIWLHLSATVISNDENVRFLAILLDITAQKDIESERERLKYGNMLLHIYNTVFELDYEKKTLSLFFASEGNSYAYERQILSLDEVQKSIVETIHKNDVHLVYDFLKSPLHSDITGENNIEYRYVRKNGDIMWISSELIYLEKNKYLLCNRNISETKMAKEILVEQQRRQHLMDSIPGGMFRYSAEDDMFDFISPNTLRMLGYTDEEFRRKFKNQFTLMLYSEDRERVLMEINEQINIKKQDKGASEYRIEAKNGELRWVYGVGSVETDENGKRWYSVVITDRTQEINTQNQLDRTLSSLTSITDSMHGGLILYHFINDTFVPTYLSKGIGKLFGITNEEYTQLLKKDITALIYSEDKVKFNETLRHAAENDEPITLSYRIFNNSSYVWISASFKNAGKVNGVLHISAVFTELSQQSQLYKKIADISSSAIIVCDAKTHELFYANTTAHIMLGVSKSDYTGMKCHQYFCQSDVPCLFCVAGNMKKGEMFSVETYMNKFKKYFNIRSEIIEWAGREAFIEYIDDITARKTAENRIQEILTNTPVAVCMYKCDGIKQIPIYLSSQFANVLEDDINIYSEDVAIPFNNNSMIHPDDREQLIEKMKTAIENTHRFEHIFRSYSKKKSKYIWLKISAVTIPQPDGSQNIYASYTNIDKEMTLTLTLRGITNNVPGGITMVKVYKDKEVEPIIVSDGFGKLLGHQSGGFEKHIASVHPDDRKIIKAVQMNLLEKNEPYNVNYRAKNVYGKYIWIEQRSSCDVDENGDTIVYSIFTDITAQKEIQNTLYNNALLLQKRDEITKLLLEKNNTLILLDYDVATKSLEYTKSSSDKKIVSEKIDNCPDYILNKMNTSVAYRRKLAEILKELSSNVNESTIDIPIGNTEKRLRFYLHSLADEKGRIYRIIGKIERIGYQEEMEFAKCASNAKSHFLASMSHDLRTPINAILGMTALAKGNICNRDELLNTISQIDIAGNLLIGMVSDVLDMSDIERGVMLLNKEAYSYSEFCDVIKVIISPMCKAKNITLSMINEKSKVIILVDKVRFNQLFFNLLSNAVKFTPNGGKIDFVIEKKAVSENIFSFDFLIRDNGIGISEDFQKRMFEPFTQENLDVATDYQGAGLGLSIARSIVEAMKGSIEINSKKNRGTDVKVHLDIDILEDVSEDIMKKSDSSILEALRGKHILVVEDNKINSKIVVMLMERKGIKCDCAYNGKEAVDMFSTSEPYYYDAIVMDIRMPVMDGHEAAKYIRKLERADVQDIPIIALSANAFNENIKKSSDSGMQEHLAKPIDSEKLYDVLVKYILSRNKDSNS